MYVGFALASLVGVLLLTLFGLRTQRFKKLAFTDSLTQLPNRAALSKQIEQAIAIAAKRSRLTAVIFFDLDNFKTINDELGHAIGDRVLSLAAKRLASGIREGDSIARFGGDEFVVVANNLRKDSDARLVYKRLTTLLELPFKIGIHEIKLGASAGIATTRSRNYWTPEDLVQNADTALYLAKAAGRGVACIFTPIPS
jgi:diguanylate cyclase (GGDEF)-like protein